jgi:hypothetical protein
LSAEVFAVAAQVDTGKNNFLAPGFLQLANLANDHVGGQTPAWSSDRGNDAKGAASITPVLDLERGASAIVRENGRKMEYVGNLSNQDTGRRHTRR